jgi:putative heme iron utilization protein
VGQRINGCAAPPGTRNQWTGEGHQEGKVIVAQVHEDKQNSAAYNKLRRGNPNFAVYNAAENRVATGYGAMPLIRGGIPWTPKVQTKVVCS